VPSCVPDQSAARQFGGTAAMAAMYSKEYIHKCGEETGRKGADWERFKDGITDFQEIPEFSGLITLTDSFRYLMFELLNRQILLANSAAL
jgi:hypothetical protein